MSKKIWNVSPAESSSSIHTWYPEMFYENSLDVAFNDYYISINSIDITLHMNCFLAQTEERKQIRLSRVVSV